MDFFAFTSGYLIPLETKEPSITSTVNNGGKAEENKKANK